MVTKLFHFANYAFFFKYDGYLSVFIQVWKPLYYKKFCIFFVCLTGYGSQ